MGLAGCLLVCELALGLALPVHRGRHEVDTRVAQIASLEGAPRAVLLADSLSFGALVGEEDGRPLVGEDVLDLASNQSIGVAGNAFLLRRLLEATPAAPERVVYASYPHSFRSNLDSERFLEPYFTSVFTAPEEIADVERLLDRPDLDAALRSAGGLGGLYPPSHTRRGWLLDRVSAGLRSAQRALLGGRSAPKAGEAARQKIAERAALPGFEASEVTRAFLPELIARCEERGIELVLVTAPLPPSLKSAWEASGYWEQYEAWRADLAAAHPETVRVLPCPWTPSSDDEFYDGVHVVPSTRIAWGRALAGLLEQ